MGTPQTPALEEKMRLQDHLSLQQQQQQQSPAASQSRSPASGSNTEPTPSPSSPPADLHNPKPPPRYPGLPLLDYRLYHPALFDLSADKVTIKSSVPYLSTSADALVALVRQQATVPPKPQIHVVGRRGSSPTSGRVDFSIKLNLMALLVPEDPRQRMDYLRCVGPGEVAFRGGSKPSTVPEVEGDGGLEAWAARFVADGASVKQFVLERAVVNLDVDWLEGQIRSLVVGMRYPGTVAVSFPVTHSRVVVQNPDRVNKFITSVTGFFAGKRKYEVVKAVWPFATMPRGGEPGSRRCAVQSEEVWWREWKGSIRHAIATKRHGWVTNEDKLEALMEGTPSTTPENPSPSSPPHLWPRLDRLRALYDKAYPKWPPHVNLVYPFVRPESLAPAVEAIGAGLGAVSRRRKDGRMQMRLGGVGVFQHRRDNTIYLTAAGPEDGEKELERLRGLVLGALGANDGEDGKEKRGKGKKGYKMHLTVAQSEDVNCAAHKFLVEKVGLVPRVEWRVGELAVLVRERGAKGESVMRLWGTVGLDGRVERVEELGAFYDGLGAVRNEGTVEDEGEEGEEAAAERDQLQSGMPFYFEEETERWVSFAASTLETEREERTSLTVASYNVLAEFEWPASEARYPLLVKNILAENAEADVLVLQEVTDGFLSYLLGDEQIRDAYSFCSHGPPSQDDIEPLPNYLNIVVLSKTAFDWEYVSFHRKHKGAVVACFKDIGRFEGNRFLPVVLAAVHLSHGLTDGAVAAKKADIKRITGYLSEMYPKHPWILAGDFNVTTSSASIDAALKKKTISDLSATHLASLDKLFAEVKLDDAWRTAVADGDESDLDSDELNGEQGATWDPTANGMAAAMAAGGGNTRPQRYDRILVRGEGLLEVSKFNMFGFLTEQGDARGSDKFASDHWGIRCTLTVGSSADKAEGPSEEIASLVVPVHLKEAPEPLSQEGSVEEALIELGVIPSEEEASKRETALDLLKSVILDAPAAEIAGSRVQPAVVVVPVGSYALDVWTSSSDIDVLCIGPFSTNTFFALASQRLRKAAAQGIRILRRVKAHTGTMLEIEVHDIKMDLQYCPATSVAERWPAVLRTPPSDPIWSLSAPTLSKLKAIRDIDYLRRSIPDLATFRLAHRAIKTWAKSRGIYSARFGFLSGIQISILLARVHKLLAHNNPGTPPSAETLLATFFTHYAAFPFHTHLAFDPFFHRARIPYTRTTREPLAILGFFPPTLNTALAASIPSAQTLAAELRRASDALTTTSTIPSSWTAFLSAPAAAADFLAAHKTFVKLDVQYWGLGLARGAQLLGWVESRCVALLVDLQRRAPGVRGRMWPGRFVERAVGQRADHHDDDDDDDDEKEGENVRDFRGCYLVGLDKADPDMGKEELKIALGALQGVLARFEGQMRGDEKYFDARSCWLSAGVVNRAELGELEIDRREWGEYTPGDEEEEEEEEEEEQEQGSEEESGPASEEEEFWTGPSKKEKKKKGAAARRQIAVVDLRADKTKKFRTAADAMNRIRWDPELDSSDYVVGYEDRFTGAQEKELEAWKSEQTDEEFIPQHRILYFKRKSDGRKVWDRRTRFDELFGNVV
ncbi:hypothetical protein NEMBOFW57_007503 [Staphylotrichum longicolle]|uniref:polynucleotide adenylyltransferase n=1 Tax=Staphylotrichum longicolle TaxID=669026 RepID=A0AAD4EUR8_9PEZI|nr:hypothetical protein NEMBOFW57_007503 [Staphylotrichum longicolle]